MSSDTPLDAARIAAALTDLPGWSLDGGALVKTYVFEDFRAALGFMVRVGFDAEAMNHHPDWSNSYNRVSVRLCTHRVGNKITSQDIALALAMEHTEVGSDLAVD